MPSDIFVGDNKTTIDASETVSSVTLSEEKNIIETTADKTEINVVQQISDINITKSEATEIKLEEQLTTVIAGTPEMSGSFTGDVSVPYLSSFKSENIVNGTTNSFSLALSDTGANSTTTLETTGTNAKFVIDSRNIDIESSRFLKMYGEEIELIQNNNKLHIGSEFSQSGTDLGMRFKSSGTPFTGLFVIENLSTPSSVESLCPSIILEGRNTASSNPVSKQEFAHIGVGGTISSGYNTRYPIIINPLGFGIRLVYSANSSFSGLQPIDEVGIIDDNAHSLGMQFARWSTVYLASNPIVGSDESLKQDIESLDDAERKVAVACKGLLKKYRLRQSVEEKGDSARIHFGIVAQELQQAFNAEGLDPERYAMFCSDTCYEHEGNIYSQEEAPEDAVAVTRLSVRYEQLLAFIISAL